MALVVLTFDGSDGSVVVGGIPLLLLHVTIEGRPHSLARELRGDGLKITPKDGMKEMEEEGHTNSLSFFARFFKISVH